MTILRKKLANKRYRAFTLVEVLVATTIMIVVLGAAASMEALYIRSADSTSKSNQASNLAEEGLTLVKILRDQNLLKAPTKNPFNYNQGTLFPTNSSQSYRIDNSQNPPQFVAGTEQIIINGVTYTRKICFQTTTCP